MIGIVIALLLYFISLFIVANTTEDVLDAYFIGYYVGLANVIIMYLSFSLGNFI